MRFLPGHHRSGRENKTTISLNTHNTDAALSPEARVVATAVPYIGYNVQ